MPDFVKLSDLINDRFTVKGVGRYRFKKWNDAEKKMQTADTYFEGAKKSYPVETDKGILDLGPGQIGSLLQESLENGKADLIGKTFEVKSNGKDKLDRRYFLNLVPTGKVPIPSVEELGL